MSDPGDRPEYKVYRSRRGGSLRDGGDLQGLRDRLRGDGDRQSKRPGERKRITPGRVVKWLVLAVLGWVLLSFVLFVVSAQIQGGVSGEAENALGGSGNLFSGATILVLGSDERKGDSIDESDSGPGRADTILLMRFELGGVRALAIPRDAGALIPGTGGAPQKINGAFAIGGPSLMIQTVEGFLGNGVEIDHLIEVDFADFPAFIDALGGITVQNKTKICAPPFDNFFRGFNLKKGKRELNGRRALGYARVRKNPCAPAENDLDRAARQQEVIRSSLSVGKLLSPSTFLRLPLVAWRAPRTFETDLKGPGLLGLTADAVTAGGLGETRVLQPSSFGDTLEFADSEKAAAVDELLGRD